MPVSDYYGEETVDLDVDEVVEVDLNGNIINSGTGRHIERAIVDGKGELIVGAGNDMVDNLAPGADGTALIADSTAPLGLRYGAPTPEAHNHDIYATDTDLAAHEADTTNIHGIADTSALETQAGATSKVSTHAGAADPHPVYETSAEAAAKVTAHEAAGDPHPVYETSTEAAAKVTAHEGAADPHTGYQKESEKGAASGYAGLDATTKVPTAQLGTGTANSTTFLRGDQSWGTPAGGGGATIFTSPTAPVGPATDALWLDTDEGAETGLSSIIGYGELASTFTGTAAAGEQVVTGLSVTVTVPAGRRLRVTAHLHLRSTVATDVLYGRLMEDATQKQFDYGGENTTGGGTGAKVVSILSPTAGTHVYTAKIARAAGSGTPSVYSLAGEPSFILVEDITGTLWPAGQSIGAGTIASEAWDTWVPTLTGITVGNGSVVAAYVKIGRTVHYRFRFILGTTSAITGNMTFTLPVPASSAAWGSGFQDPVIGQATYADMGVITYLGTVVADTTLAGRFASYSAAGAVLNMIVANATTPFTFGSTDQISAMGTYEAAS